MTVVVRMALCVHAGGAWVLLGRSLCKGVRVRSDHGKRGDVGLELSRGELPHPAPTPALRDDMNAGGQPERVSTDP